MVVRSNTCDVFRYLRLYFNHIIIEKWIPQLFCLLGKKDDFRDNSPFCCDIILISEQDADGQTICAD